MSEASFFCPHCGAEIAIEARQVQGELPLGPIELKNKLDSQGPNYQAERPRDTIRFGSISESASFSSHPLAERDSIRIVSERIASCEEDLIESIRRVAGEKDWRDNQRLWTWCVKEHPKAAYHAIEDWKLHDHRRHPIKKPAAWLMDRFKRAKSEIDSAKCFSTRKIEGR